MFFNKYEGHSWLGESFCLPSPFVTILYPHHLSGHNVSYTIDAPQSPFHATLGQPSSVLSA